MKERELEVQNIREQELNLLVESRLQRVSDVHETVYLKVVKRSKWCNLTFSCYVR